MLTPQLLLDVHHEIVVDVFAGAGGMSTGIERAIGRYVDDAINHNPNALSLHQANHPQTRHHIKDVREVCPYSVARGRPVGGLHLSPDCTHHSQAKGGQPRSEELRALPWVAARWIGTVKPRMVTGENVRELLLWGPLVAKRCPETGRVVKVDGTVAKPGERTPRHEQYLVPDKKRQGQHWRRFVAIHHRQGYQIEWRVLNAADHDVPTKRRRLVWIARRDGAPIVWPEPVRHEKPKRGQKRWRAAAEAIDFSIPCPSIFTRERPLAEATLRRIAHGMRKFVLECADPFIVEIANWSREGVYPIGEPLRTITAQPKGGSFALAAATLVQMGYGEREGQAPRALDIGAPLGTVVAGGRKHGMAAAMLVQANGGFNATPARACSEPMSTITTTGSQQQLVMAHLAHLRNNCSARDLREPLHVISAGGEHHALVEYHLSREQEEGALHSSCATTATAANGPTCAIR
jgi:DNA (cytosine-5)-methyltransferase 1